MSTAEGEVADSKPPCSRIAFVKSGLVVETAARTLLDAALEAGLTPRFRCRMGVCRSCLCNKVDGVVRDTRTREIDATPNSRIKLCVSEPLSAVTLSL